MSRGQTVGDTRYHTMETMKLEDALKQLKSGEKKKFDQSVELLINLRLIDVKKDQVTVVINLPHKFKDKKVAGFLTEKSKLVDSITEQQFAKYSDKKELKNLVKRYDYFIAAGKLMPKVATVFGKVLGPAGKMPSPQLGILMQENEAEVKKTLDKISTSIKLRLKEASFKLAVGKESMDEKQIVENIKVVYQAIENALPKKKENVKNVMVKLTMTKPVKVEVTQ